MVDVEQARREVAEWLFSCQNRFYNMFKAQLDPNGYPRLQEILKDYDKNGYLTVGQVQYLFSRTDHRGAYSDYNTHRNYHKKYGNMLPCPVKALIDANVVKWETGRNGIIHGPLVRAIEEDTNWRWYRGNLCPQQHTTFNDLFGPVQK